MRLATRLLLFVAFAASLAGTAPAAPSTTLLDELRTLLTSRRDAIGPGEPLDLQKERARLTKALAAFGAPSSSLEGDVKILGRVAKAVEGPPIDAATDVLLQRTIADLGRAAVPLRDALAAWIGTLIAPKLESVARGNLAGIDAAIDAAITGSGSVVARAPGLRSALAAIAATNAKIDRATACRGSAARPGKGRFACLVDDVPTSPDLGAGVALVDTGWPVELTLTGYGASARSDALSITWGTGAFTGTGSYDLDGSSGVLITLVEDGTIYYSVSGRVEVTAFDAVSRKVGGTFEGVLDSNSGAKHVLTRGTFSVCSYAAHGK